ncbi:RecF/RecN/SMC protein [Myriangium duriaei CBS 260.36]|uniref:Structural maintenance of chromosomes protein n=1 Tax=Myriangium duriaei CBS 260.36 TaxID=1168546 RepID=A0A9P4IW61_9PEZI|nr:RecF/RecN/SMC protein [Myriangium duriaei CBS 260.36]
MGRRQTIAEEENDEEEFTPAPARTQRSSRRKTTDGTNATPRAARTRRARISESVEPSQIFSPPESVADPASPTRTASPPKRRSVKGVRAARKSRVSAVSVSITEDGDTEMTDALPTPAPSQHSSPEPDQTPARHTFPLADITESAMNERNAVKQEIPSPTDDAIKAEQDITPRKAAPMEVKKLDSKVTILERPMDIVVRTRQAAIPAVHEPAEPKARTVITYLILNNFKSYAGRQEVGPFHASFSSVVGPNGSGKSNVIDSLLFVFGFRASKMRQGKLSALIHNSSQHPDLEYCEVEVHFQEVMDLPGGSHSVVPGSQLVISRRAFKNNSSNYYINGKTSNFTTVTTLLKDKGVDLDHKRFLILQGEVESIAQMKPKALTEHDDGLLEYLEDIIGTSKYKAPIEESATETERLNEVCTEKNGRVQHVEKEKNALEDKKNKALEFIRNENELATKQAALYQIYTSECTDNIAVTEEAIGQLQQTLNEELEKHKGNEDGIKRIEKEYKKGQKEYENLEKDSQAILKEAAKLDKETVKFEEKKKFLVTKAKKLEKAVDTSRYGVSESTTLAQRAADDIARNQGLIETLEAEMQNEEAELSKIRESLKGKTQSLSDQIAAKQKLLEPWTAKINDKKSAIAVAQSELDILRERENAGAAAIAEMQDKIVSLNESQNTKAKELQGTHVEIKNAQAHVKKVSREMEKLAAREPELRTKLSGARQKADEARASLSATQTQGNVLSGLMRLKESGRIDGFHGRLGNLGTIDARFDVAISTACPALDNMVVDSVEVGQQCIEYLRKNNLGRANFILLDRLPKRNLDQIQTPECVPRLFDLVKPKYDILRPAFYSVLQNTLVAKDLEQANRIAYGAQRWRVVTLEGALIDKSGTMSGGGTRVAKGAMSSKAVSDTSKEQVQRLEVDRDALEKEFSELQEGQRELEAALRSANDKIPQLETRAQKFELELDSLERNIADSNKRIKDIAAEQKPSASDHNRIAELEKTIAKAENEVYKLQAESADLEDEIKALQDKIMEVGGVKLRSQKAKVDGLKEQINNRNEEMSSAEVAKVKAEKQLIKHEKAYNESVAELEKVQEEGQEVVETMKQHANNAAGIRQQAEDANETLISKKDELQSLKASLEEQQAELNSGRGAEIEMKNKLEENQKVLKDNQQRLRHWSDKLSKLTLQNISDEGEELDPLPIPEFTKDELDDLSKDELKSTIASLEESTSPAVELSVLAEYRRRVTEHASRTTDLNTALAKRDTAKKRLDDLRRLRLEGFMEGFSAISLRLKEMYQMITMGGNAELELVDSLDPFSEGILFSVMPPKKSWKNISNLSGGEKTLSSLALVFALHHYKPTPLYVMDEIDAALDFRNVSIVASYIKERTKNAQFIVISLRNNMFELASRLVGVYKVNHMTKSVTVENRDYITRA